MSEPKKVLSESGNGYGRAKSINDIYAQVERIRRNGSPDQWRVANEIADRYRSNIEGSETVRNLTKNLFSQRGFRGMVRNPYGGSNSIYEETLNVRVPRSMYMKNNRR